MQTFKFTWILVVTVHFDSGCQVFIYVLTVFFVENGGFQPTFFFFQAVSAIAYIRKAVPIHLELASMTDKEYMNSIMQEVHVKVFLDETRSALYSVDYK